MLMIGSLKQTLQTPRAPSGILVPREQTDTSANSTANNIPRDRSTSRTLSQGPVPATQNQGQQPAPQTGNFLLMQPSLSRDKDRDRSSTLLSNLFTTLMSSQPQVVMANNQDTSDSDMILEVNLDALKSSRLKLLAGAEQAVLNVCKLILEDQEDPYEAIRAYSEIAQDTQFNLIEVSQV